MPRRRPSRPIPRGWALKFPGGWISWAWLGGPAGGGAYLTGEPEHLIHSVRRASLGWHGRFVDLSDPVAARDLALEVLETLGVDDVVVETLLEPPERAAVGSGHPGDR